jgi:hypothetical protein
MADETTGALTTEKQSYRTYIQTSSDKDGKTVVDKIKAQAEATQKVTDKTDPHYGLAVNWAKLEKEGWTLLCENEFIRYSVKTLEGFFALVPDLDQQLYLIQCGINYAMNAKANAAMVVMEDGAAEPKAKFDGVTIDLRTGVDSEGTYSINEAPSRKSLSDIDKLMNTLKKMGLPPEQVAALLAQAASSIAATQTEEEVAV